MNDASPTSDSVNAEPPAMAQPFRNAPAFWAQHDGYMKQLEKINQESKDMGIEWNVGIELECRLDPVEELHHFKHQAIKQATTYFPSETFGTWEEWKNRKEPKEYRRARDEAYNKVDEHYLVAARALVLHLLRKSSIDYLKDTYGEDFNETLDNMSTKDLLHLWDDRREDIDFDSKSEPTSENKKDRLLETTRKAALRYEEIRLTEYVSNLAALRSGGDRRSFMRYVKDCVFRSKKGSPYFYEEKYRSHNLTEDEMASSFFSVKELKKDKDYDSEALSIMEFRFHHTSPDNVVSRFYEVVNRAKQEASRMGFQLNIRPNIHFHISAQDIETGKSITSEKEEYLDDCHAILEGVAQSLEDGRCLYDHDIKLETPAICVAPGKHAAINTLSNRLELRTGDIYPPQPEKYLAMALSGALHALKHKDDTLTHGKTKHTQLAALTAKDGRTYNPPFWLREGADEREAHIEPVISDCRPYNWQQLGLYEWVFKGKDRMEIDAALTPGQPTFAPSSKKGFLKKITGLPVTFHSAMYMGDEKGLTNKTYRLAGKDIPAEYRTSKHLEHGHLKIFNTFERPPVEPVKGQDAVDKLKNSAIFNEQWDQELLDATVAIAQEREREHSQSRGR